MERIIIKPHRTIIFNSHILFDCMRVLTKLSADRKIVCETRTKVLINT